MYGKYRAIAIEFAREEKTYFGLLALVAAGAFGFTLTNFSIGKDDIYLSNEFGAGLALNHLGSGRWANAFFDWILGHWLLQPFFGDFVGVLLLCLSCTVWVVLFREVSRGNLRRSETTAFALVVVCFPLINEIFIYSAGGFIVGMGYLLTGLALIASYEVFVRKAHKVALAPTILLLALAIGLYESFAAVFLCGTFCTLILIFLFDGGVSRTGSTFAGLILRYAGVLAAAVLVKVAIAASAMRVMGSIEVASGPANQIAWIAQDTTLFRQVGRLLAGLFYWYVYNGIFYQPVAVFLIANAIAAGIAAILARKYGSPLPVVLWAGLGMANISTSIVQGVATPYRACQSFAVYCGFVVMVTLVLARDHRRVFAGLQVLVFLLVFWQARDLSLWFFNDYRRFEMDKGNLLVVARDIERIIGKDSEKAVIFVGRARDRYPGLRADSVKESLAFLPKPFTTNQTNGNSVFGLHRHGAEFFGFMEFYGFRFRQPAESQVLWATSLAKSWALPAFPMDGYIRQAGDAVVVNLGLDYSNAPALNEPFESFRRRFETIIPRGSLR